MTLSLRLLSILLLTFFILNCNRPDDGTVCGHKDLISVLDSVETVLDNDAPYADSLVRLIDPKTIKSRKLHARYALLYTAAEYKNYQPFTTDSLIMEAVRYYSIDKNIDYRFLSYYYSGCVYLELNNIADASVALSQAELFVDEIDNDYWKGLLYSRFGFVFEITCNYNKARDYYIKAEESFERAGREKYRIYAMLDVGQTSIMMKEFSSADSLLQIAERQVLALGDSSLQYECFLSRLSCLSYMHEPDKATELIDRNSILIDGYSKNFKSILTMSRYYIEVKDYEKAQLLLDRSEQFIKTKDDSINFYFFKSRLAYNKGEIDKAFYYFRGYSSIQNTILRYFLNQPAMGAQYDVYRSMTKMEALKAHNKIITLVSFIIFFSLLAFMVCFILLNKKRQTEERIRDYVSSINDLTTQVSVNKDRINKLNDKVREMLRQQFNPSDYLYTRYYEQIEDSKKAERLYKVISTQMEGFTNRKNIGRIDELLNDSFDGIMGKVLSSGIDIKEKDLLLLRFVLAGFSSKSVAALLGDTHLNVNQRKKRLLDRIQINNPNMARELSIALSSR